MTIYQTILTLASYIGNCGLTSAVEIY